MTSRYLSRALAILSAFAIFSVSLSLAHAAPPQRVIVKYRLTPTVAGRQLSTEQASAEALSEAQARVGVRASRVRLLATGAEVVQVDRELSPAELNTLIETLRANAAVEYAEEDRLLKRLLTPNDTRYNEQWHYFESTAGINAPTAWDTSTGAGVTVAVVDTGYRPHADLVDNIVGGYDFISDATVGNDGNARDSDARDPGDWTDAGECDPRDPAYPSSWHGTHVAGTVAAKTNNSSGVAGVAFNARVVPVRVLGRCGGFTSDIAEGIVWASGGAVNGVPANANPAKVINISLGGPGNCSSTLQSAINSARGRGTALVVAAGNENQNAANVNPANCSGVIVIASVTRAGGRAWYSNFGTVVDVAAPGGDLTTNFANDVLSTANSGATTPGSDNYLLYAGTSMATPHVAGIVALMAQVNPSLTPDQIESILRSTARAFPRTCSQCGTGIVNAAAAVAAAPGGGGGSCPVGYTTHTGTLSGTGSSSYKPSTSGYSVTVSGSHLAQLTGTGTDFDLYLQKRRSNGTWNNASSSLGSTSTESLSYSGTSGTYRWRVYSYSGSGTFQLCTKTP